MTDFFTTYCEERMMQRKRLKAGSNLKMTGEDIQEKVFDEYLSLEELDKELAKLEDLAMFGWGSYEHKNK